MEILDQSDKKEITDSSKNKSQEYFNSQVFGEGGPEVLDDGDFYEMQENENKPKGIFGKFTSALKNYIGNWLTTYCGRL